MIVIGADHPDSAFGVTLNAAQGFTLPEQFALDVRPEGFNRAEPSGTGFVHLSFAHDWKSHMGRAPALRVGQNLPLEEIGVDDSDTDEQPTNCDPQPSPFGAGSGLEFPLPEFLVW
uniref:Uncharacterized protein n=1 Tax=uncultured delta proteobacterium HF0500_03A04 TaxID=710834 RepID=E0XY31_9DELT|nr:hypothetical protein [uncultured delta proteobacterium HF0500_03A04]